MAIWLVATVFLLLAWRDGNTLAWAAFMGLFGYPLFSLWWLVRHHSALASISAVPKVIQTGVVLGVLLSCFSVAYMTLMPSVPVANLFVFGAPLLVLIPITVELHRKGRLEGNGTQA